MSSTQQGTRGEETDEADETVSEVEKTGSKEEEVERRDDGILGSEQRAYGERRGRKQLEV